MSRIGIRPVLVPQGVKVNITPTQVNVEGPKGKLSQSYDPLVEIAVKDNAVHVARKNDSKQARSFHGLYRKLISNMVVGVSEGFKKTLVINGVGYRAEVKGKQVIFALGYSHAVVFDIPAGIDIVIDKQTHITVTGVDRQLVGQVAANIRRLRKPDPYKQKGVRYTGEVLKKKAGKTGAK